MGSILPYRKSSSLNIFFFPSFSITPYQLAFFIQRICFFEPFSLFTFSHTLSHSFTFRCMSCFKAALFNNYRFMFGKQRIVIGFGRHRTRRLVNRSTVILIDRESAESLPQKNWSTARGLSTTYLVTAQRLVDIFFFSKPNLATQAVNGLTRGLAPIPGG